MSDKPLVAIITPAYNAARTLEATMASVQAQTYPHLVHCVVDNACKDETPAIIERFRHGRVPVVAIRNPGVLPQTENWNMAARLAPKEARYIQLLCADDLIRADAVARMVDLAETDPAITYVSSVDVFDDTVRPAIAFDQNRNVFDGKELMRAKMRDELRWMPWATLFIRKDVGYPEGTFFENRAITPDADLVMRWAAKGKVGYIWEPLIYTRWHQGTVTAHQLHHQRALLLLPVLQYILWYGRDVLGSDYEAVLGRALRKILRHRLIAKARRDANSVALFDKHLSALGLSPGPLDYAQAVVEWPAWRRHVEALEQAEKDRGYGRPMTEEEFVRSAPAT